VGGISGHLQTQFHHVLAFLVCGLQLEAEGAKSRHKDPENAGQCPQQSRRGGGDEEEECAECAEANANFQVAATILSSMRCCAGRVTGNEGWLEGEEPSLIIFILSCSASLTQVPRTPINRKFPVVDALEKEEGLLRKPVLWYY